MSIFDKPWTDGQKWAMGIASAVLVALIVSVPKLFGGEVAVSIAEARDIYGRCVDAEVFVENNTKADAEDIVIYFDVDYFTKEGSVELEYNNEAGSLITSVSPTLLPRLPFISVAYGFDPTKNAIVIPVLRPNEYLHLFIGAEVLKNPVRANARRELLIKRESELMNKPKVLRATRKDGTVHVKRVIQCF